MATYVKKLIAAHGWQRRLDAKDEATGALIPMADQPFMRIAGIVKDGWLEVTDTADQVRWIGTFHALSVRDDASVQAFVSRNMIFPDLDAALLAMFKTETKKTTISGRTDTHYILQAGAEPSTLDDFSSLHFVADVSLRQAENRRGYEYVVSFVKSPIVTFDMETVSAGLPVYFVAPEPETPPATQTLAGDPAVTDPQPEPEPSATETEAGHGKGKRRHAA